MYLTMRPMGLCADLHGTPCSLWQARDINGRKCLLWIARASTVDGCFSEDLLEVFQRDEPADPESSAGPATIVDSEGAVIKTATQPASEPDALLKELLARSGYTLANVLQRPVSESEEVSTPNQPEKIHGTSGSQAEA